MLIKETQNYKLIVGSSTTQGSTPCYQIINKKYGVVEVESFILPQGIKWLDDLEASLAAVNDIIKEGIFNFPLIPKRGIN